MLFYLAKLQLWISQWDKKLMAKNAIWEKNYISKMQATMFYQHVVDWNIAGSIQFVIKKILKEISLHYSHARAIAGDSYWIDFFKLFQISESSLCERLRPIDEDSMVLRIVCVNAVLRTDNIYLQSASEFIENKGSGWIALRGWSEPGTIQNHMQTDSLK